MRKLDDPQTEKLLKKYAIPVVKQFLAKNEKQAVQQAKKLGFPVVMKISSPDIIHKTESKGIVLGVREKEVISTFKKIIKNTRAYKRKARIEGILIQEQVKGREVIVGSKIDLSFGPVLMFGLGGIFVEVLKDVSFRLIPIERADAKEMIQEIKGYPILKGVRGEKPIHFKKLEDFLLKVSRMIQKTPRIQELDINPLFVNAKEALAADVRVLV